MCGWRGLKMEDKKLFQITIEETISECFDVYADNIDEAIQMTEDKYNNGEFILAPGNITNRKMFIVDEDIDLKKEWIEF